MWNKKIVTHTIVLGLIFGIFSGLAPGIADPVQPSKEMIEAISSVMGPGEKVVEVLKRRMVGDPELKDQYTVLVGSTSEATTGSLFYLTKSESDWRVLDFNIFWVACARNNPHGFVKILSPVDLQTASSVVGYLEGVLPEGEYVSMLSVCERLNVETKESGEKEISGVTVLPDCIMARVSQGLQSGNRRFLEVSHSEGAFEIVGRGVISH